MLPVLDFTLLHNTGAAFSFLAGASGWQRWFFIGLAAVVSVVLVAWIWRTPRGEKLLPLALSLILGGALGNVIDRVEHGYVVDFIHVHWGAAYFPAFNVADTAITVGAALLILDALPATKAGMKNPARQSPRLLRRRRPRHRHRRARDRGCSARRSTCATRWCTTASSSTGCAALGAVFVEELDEVPDGATVIFSAHGVSRAVRGRGAPPRPARCSTPPARW